MQVAVSSVEGFERGGCSSFLSSLGSTISDFDLHTEDWKDGPASGVYILAPEKNAGGAVIYFSPDGNRSVHWVRVRARKMDRVVPVFRPYFILWRI